jgi:hypothetical protein
MSTSITTKNTEGLREDKTNRYQSLVQKKATLEKRLNEKYEQLHQLCQKVSKLHSAGNFLGILSMTSLKFDFAHFHFYFKFLGG